MISHKFNERMAEWKVILDWFGVSSIDKLSKSRKFINFVKDVNKDNKGSVTGFSFDRKHIILHLDKGNSGMNISFYYEDNDLWLNKTSLIYYL